jgi:hypothetical protein
MQLPASILSLLFTTILLGASIAASHERVPTRSSKLRLTLLRPAMMPRRDRPLPQPRFGRGLVVIGIGLIE